MAKTVDVIVEQSKETALHQETDESGITIRYSYFRAAETREKNKNGQDYLSFHLEPGRAIFALCDGVSGSFSGDIGARLLGIRLIKWLNNEICFDDPVLSPGDPERNRPKINNLVIKLSKELDALKQEVSIEIHKRDLSTIDDEWLREELEERREIHGTQSNFTCGIIEAPRKGLEYGRVVIFWLGDAKLRWYVGMQDRTDQLGAQWITDERWSSKNGIMGETIHGYMDVCHKVSTLVAHSDGMDPFPVQWYQPFIHREILDSHFEGLWERPSNDDVSFIEINIQNKNYPPLNGFSQPPKLAETTPIQPEKDKSEPSPTSNSTASKSSDENLIETSNTDIRRGTLPKSNDETRSSEIIQPSTSKRESERQKRDQKEPIQPSRGQTNYGAPNSRRELSDAYTDNDFGEENKKQGIRGWFDQHAIDLGFLIKIAIAIGIVLLLIFGLPWLCKVLTLWLLPY